MIQDLFKSERYLNYLLGELSKFNPKILAKPSRINAQITNRCNFKCKACDVWKSISYKDELSAEEWSKIFRKLWKWLGNYDINIVGGEIFLRKDIFRIISSVKQYSHCVRVYSNGYLIDKALAKRIAETKVRFIKISLYSLDPTLFQFLRGKNGLKKVLIGIENLRKYCKHRPEICLAVLVTKRNFNELDDLANYAKSVGIGIAFQPMVEPFLSDKSLEWYDSIDLFKVEKKEIETVFEHLTKLKKTNYPILTTQEELRDMKKYYLDPSQVLETRCIAPFTNITIHPNGDVSTCLRSKIIGNLKEEDPESIWRGEKAIKVRAELASCRKHCRILSCNKHLSFSNRVQNYLKDQLLLN